MALTGDLSDLSLSELIEFFCNQRKIGRLKVLYPQGPGYFYLQTGSVIDARVGVLRGIDAVYYALTLPNANFEFSGSSQTTDRTINQPWTQVVLEGLRRLDEGIAPLEAFPAGYVAETNELEMTERKPAPQPDIHTSHVPAFLSFMDKGSMGKRKPLVAGSIVLAVIASAAGIGIPAGWYGKGKVVVTENRQVNVEPTNTQSIPAADLETPRVTDTESGDAANPSAPKISRRLRERERARAREERAALNEISRPSSSPAPGGAAVNAVRTGAKKIAVTVTYDESGRVTQASGGDATALRIARQKRFPAGKPGSATITIPIN